MQRIVEKHLLVTRWTHWVNFPVLFLMIWSGLLIYWANDVYRVGAFHFFPQWVYSLLHLDHSLAEGMAIHFFLAWIFVINGILYAAFTMISGQWRQLVPDRKSLVQAIKVTLYDLGLSKEMPPQGKYNGAQKIAQVVAIQVVPGVDTHPLRERGLSRCRKGGKHASGARPAPRAAGS